MTEQRPNILLIQADQWRADCLGFTGHQTVETPHLDRLSMEGVNFSQAYAAVPSCIAARASLWTGLTPRSHGRVGYKDRVPWRYETTLASLLAGGGYHTQAVGKMHVFPARNLIGFHNVVLHDGYLHTERKHTEDMTMVDDYLPWLRERCGPAADYIDTGIGCNGYVVAPWCYDQLLHPSAWVTTQSIDFLRRRDPDKPFFLYTSYHRPHPPLDPPSEYLRLYEGKPLPPVTEGDWAHAINQPARMLDSPCPSDPTSIDRAQRAYYAQITFIDHQINRLIHALYAHNLLDNTCIVFCSDHGDMLFEHNHIAKAVPYDGSARIPLIIRLPDRTGCQTGINVDKPVELRDILPSLCNLAGITIPASIEGRSLLPFCRGEQPAWRDYIHGEHSSDQHSNQWLTDGKWKYVWHSETGEEQLFHIAEDPRELRNIAGTATDTLTQWRSRLIKELEGREEGYVDGGKLVPGRPAEQVLREAGLR